MMHVVESATFNRGLVIHYIDPENPSLKETGLARSKVLRKGST
jgi:hypothetical protein